MSGEAKHTKGEWRVEADMRSERVGDVYRDYLAGWNIVSDAGEIVGIEGIIPGGNAEANARLIAAAPDHALVGQAMTLGIARWDRFELCFGGIRYSTELDEFGVPVLYDHLRDRLRAAISLATGDEGGR